jgi:hypothetical protein
LGTGSINDHHLDGFSIGRSALAACTAPFLTFATMRLGSSISSQHARLFWEIDTSSSCINQGGDQYQGRMPRLEKRRKEIEQSLFDLEELTRTSLEVRSLNLD